MLNGRSIFSLLRENNEEFCESTEKSYGGKHLASFKIELDLPGMKNKRLELSPRTKPGGKSLDPHPLLESEENTLESHINLE